MPSLRGGTVVETNLRPHTPIAQLDQGIAQKDYSRTSHSGPREKVPMGYRNRQVTRLVFEQSSKVLKERSQDACRKSN